MELNNMKGLIIGLGIGNVYAEQMQQLEMEIVTVDTDPSKSPTFTELSDALTETYDVAVICTPNFTHESILDEIAASCKNVIIEKPGLASLENWEAAILRHPDTNIMMTKNNVYRPQLLHLGDMVDSSIVSQVHITWSSSNRVPNPGSWFTTKEKAFGGVHRDLMPHLIHMAYSIGSGTATDIMFMSSSLEQHHNLESITDTEYGVIDRNGTYDVDDYAELTLNIKGVSFNLLTDWKSNQVEDMQTIRVEFKDGTYLDYEFGLCPNYCYGDMIKDVLTYGEDFSELDAVVHHILDRMTENG